MSPSGRSVGVTVGRQPREDLWPVYDSVFGDVADEATWRTRTWEPHRSRAGFRLAVATVADRPVGFSYGYTGERGQWWPDALADLLDERVATQWLGGHFELVELAVLGEYRGSGVGRRLLRSLCDGLPHERWLLQTSADPDDPARRLYADEGWDVIGPGVGSDAVLMGRRRG
ncbi:MAG: hypothetical protein CMH83_13245 [Nocardioides sp.]|nr:hypothetical protein [Nocardioides sp.]